MKLREGCGSYSLHAVYLDTCPQKVEDNKWLSSREKQDLVSVLE